MAIEDTSLMREVEAIINSGKSPVSFYWHAEILANEEIIRPLRLLSIDNMRNYDDSYGDEIVVEVLMGAGSFAHDVYPFKHNLQITLFREPIGEVSEDLDVTKDIETQVMRATLVLDENLVLQGNALGTQDKFSADIGYAPLNIKFQLVDLALEQVRMLSVGGAFQDTAPGDVVRYLLTNVSKEIQVDDEHVIQGVEMVEPDNTEAQPHIVIPHGSRFVDAPLYVNDQCSALYSTGFGYYLQKNHWYVYPLYDLTRFDKALKTLTLINVPKNRFPSIERTFRRTANQVIALVTGDVRHQDDTESLQLNQGNGIRFADARLVIDGFGETEGNKTTVLRANNNNEYVTKPRDNKLNNVQLSPNTITSNTFRELSRMARRAGSHVVCLWENSDPGAIYPGMPVKYMYMVGEEVVEANGIVLGAHHHTGTVGPGVTAKRHVTNTGLKLFIERDVNWPSNTGASA